MSKKMPMRPVILVGKLDCDGEDLRFRESANVEAGPLVRLDNVASVDGTQEGDRPGIAGGMSSLRH